ncbi:hypothetical protein Tco_1113622 [Tanacetum coccineum]|uniref:Uncharacterized protein n=1 Tax=Tanacetum coccineum TaxID=301880 RepID=A0ABQ5IWF7_9ASTR
MVRFDNGFISDLTSLLFPEEFLCWVGISRNYLLNKDTYPRFVYEDGEGEFECFSFYRTDDPRKVRIVREPELLSASVEREFAGDASVGDGRDQGFDSAAGQDNVEPSMPATEPVEVEIPRPKRSKKKRVVSNLCSDRTAVASHPPKRLRADYGLLVFRYWRFTLCKEGGDRTDSVTGPSLRTIGPSARFVVLSDSSHHSGAKSADPRVDSLVRSAASVMTEATTVATVSTTVAIPTDVSKNKSAPHLSVFGSSSSSEKTDRTLSLFAGRSGSGFDAGSIHAEEAVGAGSEEIYVPEWTVTRGFELNDGHLCANMIDHFTPPAFFKTVREMEHEQQRRTVRGVTQLRAQVVMLCSEPRALLRGEVLPPGPQRPSFEHRMKSSSSLKWLNQSLVYQVHELEISSTDLREKLEMYEGSLKQLEGFQDNLMGPLRTRLAEIDADFTRCCMRFQESFHPHLLNVVAGRRWPYIPSGGGDLYSAIHVLRDLNFPLLQELSHKKDASTWDIMDLLCLDDTVAETLDVFVSIDDPLSAEALIKPSAEKISRNPGFNDCGYGLKNATLGSESEGKIDASAGGGLTFSQLDDEARNVVL